MTNNADVVRAWQEESWADPPSSNAEAADKYFADDYTSVDKAGNVVMDKNAFVGMAPMLFKAFPDMSGVVSDVHEDGDDVIMTFHFEGTHQGELDLSPMGLGVIPPSGKRIVWPDAQSRYRVREGRIVQEQQISSGFGWFLAPLGVDLPSA
jgi:predicted ester cyclase